MALQRQTLSVSFAQGVDTKPDPYQLAAGKLSICENVSFSSTFRIRKRNGYKVLGRSITGEAGTIDTGQASMAYRNELLLADGESLFSYQPANDAWSRKGSFTSAHVTQRSVVRNTYAQTAQDSATHPMGLSAFAWEDSQGGVRYSVVDTSTGLAIVADAAIDAAGSRPKVHVLGSYLIVFYVVGTSLFYRAISVAAPDVLGAATLITNSLSSGLVYDAAAIGARCFIAWAADTGLVANSLQSSLNLGVPATIANPVYVLSGIPPIPIVELPVAISVFADSDNNHVGFAWYDGVTVNASVWDYGLTAATMATASLEPATGVVSVTAAATPGASSLFRVFWTVSAVSPADYATRTATVTAYAAGAASGLLRSVGLAGKAFPYGTGIYVPLAHQSALQSTYFVANHAGSIVARVLPGLGGGLPTRPLLPEVNALGGSQFQFSALEKGALTSEGGAVFSLTGVSSFTLDFFDRMASYLRAELGDTIHVGGGLLSMYDGTSPVEHGFHLFPEGVATVLVEADAGTTYSYGYVACYEWTDNLGHVHRSAPSPVVIQQKATTIDPTHRVTVAIPTLRLTAKRSVRRAVQIVVYRTVGNGTVYYQASSVAAPIYNDVAIDFVTFTDDVTDATLIGRPQLYTTGGVAENIAPPPVSSMAIHQNRIVLLDSTNPLQLWWSKQVVPGAPVEFSDIFVQNIDPVGGGITAIARMDSWLVIFKAEAIFITNEEGPSATGAGYSFGSGQQVPADVGCINPRSVNLGESGVTFQSSKGWHRLTRSLQIEDIPETDAWDADMATSAYKMPHTHETRFTLESGLALVHDDLVKQWGVFTDIRAVDSCIWQGVHVVLRADGQVRQETPGVFSDAGAFVRLRARTSWLQFAGLQGFQRVYKALVLGEYLSPHNLIVSVAHDFNGEPAQVSTVNVASLIGTQPYGEQSVYGGAAVPVAPDDLVYGGDFPRFQFRVDLARQKCGAIQITLEDSQTETAGEGLSLSALAFEVGLKPSPTRMPAARTVG